MRQISGKFTKLPDWLIDADISLGAFKLYAVLASYTSSGNPAFPSLTTLAKRLDVSRPTVNKWKNELVDYGAISIRSRYWESGSGQRSNEYVIHEKRRAPKTGKKDAPSKPSFTSSPDESDPRPSKASFTTLVKPALPPWLTQLYTEQEPLNKNHLTRITEPDGSGTDIAQPETPKAEGENTMSQQPALDGVNQPEPEPEVVEAEIVEDNTTDQRTAQTLIAEWLDHRTTKPPKRVIGQLSKEIKALLDEGFDYDLVRTAVGQWHQRDLHPATLPSVLDNVQNGGNHGFNGSAAERRLIAGKQRDEALKARSDASQLPVDPFALEAQHITRRQIGNGDTAA